MQIKQFLSLLFSCAVLFMVTVASSGGNCTINPPPPPPPVTGGFTTWPGPYNCWFNSPGSGVDAGVGILNVQVAGATAPFFNYVNSYDQTSPLVDCSGTFIDCCITAEFPEFDDYTVTSHYIEQESISCFTGTPGTCFRWFDQEVFTFGFVLDCTFDIIFIEQMDPNGFIGPCN